MPAKSTVTHAKALEAIHTLSSLAATIETVPPPFAYGKEEDGGVPMTPYNAQPGLVVWMFLVTNPDYLDLLDTAVGFTTPADQPRLVVSSTEIAAATNLTVPAVEAVLNVYRDSSDDDKEHFKGVTRRFQSLARDSGYPIGSCPNTGKAMLALAQQGAVLADPTANSFPA